MKKLLFIFLLPLFLIGQLKYAPPTKTDWTHAGHFYGSLALTLTAYNIQKIVIPKQKIVWRVLTSVLFASGLGFGKEFHDLKRDNIPMKFKNLNYNDIAVNSLGITTALEIQAVSDDQKKLRELDKSLYE